MTIAVDFDGTCVTHEYPRVGRDIGAAEVLKDLAADGHQLILFTMRGGKYLLDAINWFERNGIPLWSVQTNPTQKSWTDSPKCLADLYIDDAALGCPLIAERGAERAYVDWTAVRKLLLPVKPKVATFELPEPVKEIPIGSIRMRIGDIPEGWQICSYGNTPRHLAELQSRISKELNVEFIIKIK